MRTEYFQGLLLKQESEIVYEGFSFTSDAAEEWRALFQLNFQLLTEGWCCLKIETVLRRRMTEMIDKLVNEGKIFAAAVMRENRDLLLCSQYRCSNLKCPIHRFLDECLYALNAFQPRTPKEKRYRYIS